MKKTKVSSFSKGGARGVKFVPLALALAIPAAYAFNIDTGNDDIAMRWDNTVKYSAAFRLQDPSSKLINTEQNQDDGDRNFKKGLISNRLDLLSEFDFSFQKRIGFRASAAAWYDDVYQRSNDNTTTNPGAGGTGTNNNSYVPGNQFNARTKTLHGNNVDGLDAFVYVNGTLGDMPANIRIGRHSHLYGESLFFGNNGVANGMAPMDIIKLLSVPGSQFKEIIRPVNQVSGQVQLTDRVALGGYYQFRWEKNIIPSVGSYFSAADVFEGAQNFVGTYPPIAPIPAFLWGLHYNLPRLADRRPNDSGQAGMQVKWRPESVDVELGFYASTYKDRNFQVYADLAAGTYGLLYPDQTVKVYGVSASGQIGDINVSGEVSVRRDTPLVSDPAFAATASVDNKGSAPYAIGNSAHAQVSAIALLSPSSWFDQATILAELAMNRRTSTTKNPDMIAAFSSRDAWAARVLFTPIWYQVNGLLDLSMPVGLGFSTHGNSSVVPQFNPGGKNGGDFSIGLQAVYQQAYKFGVTYNHFFGEEGVALTPLVNPAILGPTRGANISFKQALADRDFVAFTFQYSF